MPSLPSRPALCNAHFGVKEAPVLPLPSPSASLAILRQLAPSGVQGDFLAPRQMIA